MRIILFLALTATTSFDLVQATISLGAASTYAVLGYTSITNAGPTDIIDSIGTVGTSITGFPPGIYSGSEDRASQALPAFEAASVAYLAISTLPSATILTGNLGGRVLRPGTYKFVSSAQLSGILILAGTGSCEDAWYF
ncbi:uncharacterized protein PAC_07862 [Phialocephala subalpina]|uniref:Uncharacterized protein n=1 Tax=Phialocephala subalpina TaxID=576137 RepID=A0A1L7WYX3_9HELO|nr:uncharacterized protein PAC_07862 [Phialocephala subalpina]